MTPITFFFSAAGVKIMCQYFLVNCFNLFSNFSGIIRGYHNLFFMIFSFINRLHKFKYSAYNIPIIGTVVIYQNFIKYSLPPVVAAVWLFGGWSQQFIFGIF